ncbi:hypothetical protein GGS24DRAFT_390394 [Hypoxylon argillaceum]|nr:hypothetical protein GGS24DRAFT_390394 [Hypoxylon argillaceum]
MDLTSGLLNHILDRINQSTLEIRQVLTTTNERLNALEASTREIGQKVDNLEKRFDSLETRFDSLEKKVDNLEKRFDSLETRLDSLETRFDSLEKKVDNLEKRFDSLETRFDSLEKKVDNLENKVDNLDKNVNTLEKSVQDTKDSLTKRVVSSKTNTLAYVENIMVGPEGPLTPFYTNNNTPIPDFPRTEKDIDEASDDQLDKLASWLEMKPIRGIEKKKTAIKKALGVAPLRQQFVLASRGVVA